jgi:hypothetical protein
MLARWLAIVMLALSAVVPASAQSAAGGTGPDGDPSVAAQIEAMRRELDRVQQENRAMRGEIDELRAYNDEQWLTEQRATEIKALVHEVLADADTRASLQDTGMTAGWNEHFFLGSTDGRFLLIFEGLAQIRFIYNWHSATIPPGSPDNNDRWRYGFENTRTQLTFRGHVFDDNIEYLVRGEYARSNGNMTLLDTWVRYLFNDEWALRFGQFKLPFARETLVADSEYQGVERSLVNLVLGLGRSQGVELQYGGTRDRFNLALSDGAQRQNTVWSVKDTEYALGARYEHLFAGSWEQFVSMTSPKNQEFGLLAGVAAYYDQTEATNEFTTTRDEVRQFRATGDVQVDWGGASLFGSAYYAYVDAPGSITNIFGFMVEGGYYIAPKWEVYARAEYAFGEIGDADIETLQLLTLGVNYYIDGQDVKWSTDISFGFNEIQSPFVNDQAGFRTDGPGGDPQVVVRTQFQLLF